MIGLTLQLTTQIHTSPHLGLLLYQTLAPSNPTSVGRGSAPASNMDLPAPGDYKNKGSCWKWLPLLPQKMFINPTKMMNFTHLLLRFKVKSYIFTLHLTPPNYTSFITLSHHHPPVIVESWPRLPFKPHWCMMCCTCRLNKFLAANDNGQQQCHVRHGGAFGSGHQAVFGGFGREKESEMSNLSWITWICFKVVGKNLKYSPNGGFYGDLPW